jgi:hypothetical protein
MLNVPPAEIPAFVLDEYRVRIHLFHTNGGSGALGTLGLIDMLRFLKVGRRPPDEEKAPTDWSRIPRDGSVRVVAKVRGANGRRLEAPGVYVGETEGGVCLGVRLDGDAWVRSCPRPDVRIVREQPTQVLASPDAIESDLPLADREPWVSLEPDEPVLVKDEGIDKEGRFQGVEGDQILVLVADDLTPRPFPPEEVTALETRLKAIADKREGEDDASAIHGDDHD